MNTGRSIRAPMQRTPASGQCPATSRTTGGVSIVVRARESRAHGKGRQSTSGSTMPQGKATYVASEADLAWLLSKQRALHARSAENPGYTYRKLWGLVTDPANLRAAFLRVARNRGSRTGGVDRMTVRQVMAKGVDTFLSGLRSELRAGTYGPSPVRRVLIPKAGQPRAFRPLGIPTVKDRVVQAAIKNILEPIFEADFYPISHGFRPGRSVHGAMAHLRRWLEPWRAKKGGVSDIPYQWVIEGDIKGCFGAPGQAWRFQRVQFPPRQGERAAPPGIEPCAHGGDDMGEA
ncbi:reverse transcriptase domain-containing protein [Sorangium sp. So ce1389]|uniref:reverse transcriptase domain-containing protein n=1 Tax=Sorangium sp. So ce1389 TaxID=3133336 RepID=UPI003F626D42